MNLLSQLYLLVGCLICAILALFVTTSLGDRKFRAAVISSGMFLIFGSAWFGAYWYLAPSVPLMAVFLGVVGLLIVVIAIPFNRSPSLKMGQIKEQVDERDIMFAREEYAPGTDRYEEYYARRPELKLIDDRIRKLPELLEPGGRFYHPEKSRAIDSIFEEICGLTSRVDGDVRATRVEVAPLEAACKMKELVLQLGADEVGIARLNPMFVYSHVGRGPEKWGEKITTRHKFAIVFTFEMDYNRVQAAPALPITEETAVQYLKAARVSIALADHIRTLGYPARAHISGSNYQIMIPPVAHDAGLGELGRLGYLISPKYGARIRLGAVTTDLPMDTDRPVNIGVQDFCEKCLKCADNCPSGAIPSDAKTDVRGVEKWQLNVEQCLHYWRVIGTDCGLCMKVCPFSHRSTLLHNLVRMGCRRSSVFRTLSVYGDDLFYGKQVGHYPPHVS